MAEKAEQNEVPEIRPCRHMEKWVAALSDDSLTGFARWYTRLHVSGCKQCQAALAALQRIHERLKALGTNEASLFPAAFPPERRQALEAALDEVEKKRL